MTMKFDLLYMSFLMYIISYYSKLKFCSLMQTIGAAFCRKDLYIQGSNLSLAIWVRVLTSPLINIILILDFRIPFHLLAYEYSLSFSVSFFMRRGQIANSAASNVISVIVLQSSLFVRENFMSFPLLYWINNNYGFCMCSMILWLTENKNN